MEIKGAPRSLYYVMMKVIPMPKLEQIARRIKKQLAAQVFSDKESVSINGKTITPKAFWTDVLATYERNKLKEDGSPINTQEAIVHLQDLSSGITPKAQVKTCVLLVDLYDQNDEEEENQNFHLLPISNEKW